MDDERLVLRSLERVVRARHPAWEIRCTQCPLEALEELRIFSADLLVTDLSMPRMHGVELLRAVRDQYPNVKRMVYSAHIESLGRREFGGLAHAALLKPAHPDSILATLHSLVSSSVASGSQRGTASA